MIDVHELMVMMHRLTFSQTLAVPSGIILTSSSQTNSLFVIKPGHRLQCLKADWFVGCYTLSIYFGLVGNPLPLYKKHLLTHNI